MSQALDNLCGPGKSLKAETPDTQEIAGLLRVWSRDEVTGSNCKYSRGFLPGHDKSLAKLIASV